MAITNLCWSRQNARLGADNVNRVQAQPKQRLDNLRKEKLITKRFLVKECLKKLSIIKTMNNNSTIECTGKK